MSLFFSDNSNPIHKIERFLKVRKLKSARQMMLLHHLPVGQLMGQVVELRSFEGRHIASTRNAGFGG
jgi:hypothetical protein